jgi:acetyl-CoA C-acetyltransferase
MTLGVPAIDGVGVATESLPIVELMSLAAQRAIVDAGDPAVAKQIDVVLVPAGTWQVSDPGRMVVDTLGSPGARSVLAQLGVSQQGILNEALRLLTSGEARRVLVVGGEARRHDRQHPEIPIPGQPDEILERPADFVDPLEIDAGIAFPAVRSYALIERAFAHRHGRSDEEAADDVARLWASMNDVATHNPRAAFPTPRTVDWLRHPSRENPPLAAPYLRAHASQWTVDQAAAFLLSTSPNAAPRQPNHRVYPHVAIESSLAVPLVRRPELSSWPAMGLLRTAAEAHLQRSLASIDLVELYSCFPVAVAVQAEELGLTLASAPTLGGGMAFAGGPFNNFVLQSLAELVSRLRARPDDLGLITTVSGLLTKPGLGVWSATPPTQGPLVDDLAPQAAGLRPPLKTTATPRGAIEIDSATAFTDADGPRAVVLGRDEHNRRCLVSLRNRAAFERFSRSGCIGEHLPPSTWDEHGESAG